MSAAALSACTRFWDQEDGSGIPHFQKLRYPLAAQGFYRKETEINACGLALTCQCGDRARRVHCRTLRLTKSAPFVRIWYAEDSRCQLLASAFRAKSSNPLDLFPLYSQGVVNIRRRRNVDTPPPTRHATGSISEGNGAATSDRRRNN